MLPLPRATLFGTLCFLDRGWLLSQVRKVLSHYFFKFSVCFFLSFFFLRDLPYNVMLSQRPLTSFSCFRNSLFVLMFWLVDFTSLSSSLLIRSPMLIDLLLVPSNVFFTSVLVFFMLAWLFLILFNSWLKFTLSSSLCFNLKVGEHPDDHFF